MTILAIETSSPKASLALWDSDSQKTLWQHSFITDRSHNSKIFDSLEQAMNNTNNQWDLIVIGTGPGSYGGVRVGIAAANGISIVKHIPLIGISSLEAYSEKPNYRVVGDARRNSYFIAEIDQFQLKAEPKLLTESELQNAIKDDSETEIFTMDNHVAEKFNPILHRFPSARFLAQRASEAIVPPTLQAIEPHYLRPPYITQAKKKPVPGFSKKSNPA